MARPVKKGLDYFPLDVDFFEKEEIKFFSVECGAAGISALIKLMCNIFRNGYYIEWSKDHETLFSWDMRGMVPKDDIPHIVEVCLKRGIFSDRLYKKYHILTSLDIQAIFLQALDGKRQINIVKEYWLLKIPERASVSRIDGNIQDDSGGVAGIDGGKTTNLSDKKRFIPPTIAEVEAYFVGAGYTADAARKAFAYYNEGGWKDREGKSVKNWKQKMISVWFTDKNLKTEENGIKEKCITF